jgi:GMP synthase-like glutamine amidotransferase
MSTCLVVQHVAPESAFALGEALLAAGVDVDTRRVFAGDAIPRDTVGLDGVLFMGGPMSATSDEGFPSRDAEVRLLSDALRVGVPTLGVCLGAQLLALAGGGAVLRGTYGPEIGWSPVHLTPACRDDRLFTGLPDALTVLQWHGETFEAPPGSQRLATGKPYANQAFRIGDMAWGVQFHLEVTAAAVDDFMAAFAADLDNLPAAAAALRANTPDAVAELGAARDLVCGRFADLVAARVTRGDLVDQD